MSTKNCSPKGRTTHAPAPGPLVRPDVHDGPPAPDPSPGSQESDHAEAVAGAERDAPKQAACRASRRRHETAEHGAPS
ncbi:hypothetical protein PUR28_19020 [Streptomyces sp. BE308]|uniref:hypothetical protein n=1 Tax=Streptomyces sp. BE308 TaxID=3002529 RepID=UPI002E7669D3|nr:hypothetical protein [Streptomyces sp. BE308]MEE1792822.1 hypothetical protein [Streptomyces sp. BE308]